MSFPWLQHTEAARRAVYDVAAGRWYSYGELREEAAHRRDALDGSPAALVFLFCRNTFDTVSWYLACLSSPHTVALLDEGLSAGFRQTLIGLYRPEYVISDTCPGDDFAPGKPTRLWRRIRPGETASLHPDLKQMLSTSGSTGTPKFVRLSLRNVTSNAEAIATELAISPEDLAITTLPLHYSYGLSVLNSHLHAGAALALTDESVIGAGFWETVRRLGCTSLAGVPYTYQLLNRLDIDSLNVPSVHTMTQAGGKLNETLIQRFWQTMQRRQGRFFVMYGQTEATARIAILPSHALPAKLGSAGRPLPGGRVEVDGNEIVYTGPNVMLGYATGRDDLGKGDELSGRLRTGDTGYLDEDGFLYVTGRSKRDAKLFGLRVNMDEVEQMLVVNGPTAVIEGDNRLVAFCEYGDDNLFARLKSELSAQLRVAALAFEFRRIDRIPTKTSGKTDYDRLKLL